MTDNTIVLQFIREELGTVRTSMQEQFSGIRSDLAALGDKLGDHVADTGKRVAVLEHRLDEAHGEIQDLKAARKDDKKVSASTRLAIGLALLSIAGSPIAALLIR